MTTPREETIEGQTTLVVPAGTGLPRKLDELLSAMTPFGFSYREDITPTGTSVRCTVERDHRLALIREGRWLAYHGLSINAGMDRAPNGSLVPVVRRIPPGVLELRLEMCRDCGAVCVRDVSSESYYGARAARLVNRETGETRVAPAVARRNIVLGWYSGARPGRREYV